jgi:ankyrin repeat protein
VNSSVSLSLLLRRTDLSVNLTDGEGNNALMLASVSNHSKVVEVILQRADVDVNIADAGGEGWTPLMQAIREEDVANNL